MPWTRLRKTWKKHKKDQTCAEEEEEKVKEKEKEEEEEHKKRCKRRTRG